MKGSENWYSINMFHLNELWKANFFILCDGLNNISLARLQGGGGGNLKVITLGSERVDICAIDCYSLFYPIQSSDIKKRQEIPGNFDKLPTLPVD